MELWAESLTCLFFCSLLVGGSRSMVVEGDAGETNEQGKKQSSHGSQSAALCFATETDWPCFNLTAVRAYLSLSHPPHVNSHIHRRCSVLPLTLFAEGDMWRIHVLSSKASCSQWILHSIRKAKKHVVDIL